MNTSSSNSCIKLRTKNLVEVTIYMQLFIINHQAGPHLNMKTRRRDTRTIVGTTTVQ